MDSADSFKNVNLASDNKARSFAFRGIILILPFITMSIIDLGQQMPQDVRFIIVAAEKQQLEENKDLQYISSIKDALGDIITFLWAALCNLIPTSLYVISSKKKL